MALKNMVHILWSCALCYTSLRSLRKSSCSIEVATCMCVYQVHPHLACLCYPLPPMSSYCTSSSACKGQKY